MNKFKIPALIFTAVFIVSATALFFYVKKDLGEKTGVSVDAPTWVTENSSSVKRPVTDTVAESLQKTEATPEDKKAADASPESTPVEKKDTGKQAAKTENSTAENTVEKAVEAIRETIVTEIFLDNLAQYVADNYHPAGTLPYKAESGFSTASFKSINMHFGLNLHGLMPEAQNLVTARQDIWSYLLTTNRLAELAKSETDEFLDLVEEKGILAERKFIEGDSFSMRELTRTQRAEMFRVSAQSVRHVAAVLKAVADNPDLVQALDSYIMASNKVESANGIFQLDLDYSQKTQTESARQKARHSGKLLKDYITIREKIKSGIVDKIKSYCAGQCDKPNDIFYIAQWFFRRVKKDEKRIKSIGAGSEILSDIAVKMENRADAIERSM
ncbi:hypothetical protein [Maridesulfovibrio sp.]|uniref:hypothetical protein n=1 Tax=Maridesulfovibrio sp. TaxID=2795000 RepID=UPI0029F4B7A2|nr:hypothetical protein [Maridesulfovibrio sp.]